MVQLTFKVTSLIGIGPNAQAICLHSLLLNISSFCRELEVGYVSVRNLCTLRVRAVLLLKKVSNVYDCLLCRVDAELLHSPPNALEYCYNSPDNDSSAIETRDATFFAGAVFLLRFASIG